MQILGTVHTFFTLEAAQWFQCLLAGNGYDSRIRLTGPQAYTVHITRQLAN